ncbi:MAG: 2-amino-4-hydroxy-6-hydroxymethyldihydropteridine diphosphokinase [Robiginitomaculum sp.]|nr:2-amino-4-hydroxy-6-hydroxymethyldihydropteridine diphosphokinase [Robiginitomaculum sp.]
MGIYIALGANQEAKYGGQVCVPAQTFRHVLDLLGGEMKIMAVSNLWQSPAWPDPEAQAPYINAVIEVETKHEPLELLGVLKHTEMTFGRTQTVRNAARPLDLDILDYNGKILESEALTLPHPRMLERPFVLFPLAEIAPDWHDPVKNRALHDWSARLSLNEVAPMRRLEPLFQRINQ